jgi:hypothetical protein
LQEGEGIMKQEDKEEMGKLGNWGKSIGEVEG